MIFRCPCCNVVSDLEHVFADETARKTMALIAKLPKGQSYPLVQYVGFFRPKKSAMSWDRVHKLISEASALAAPAALNAALATTIEALRAKQQSGEWTPLKNHNYLKQVLASQPDISEPSAAPVAPRPPVVRNDQPPPPVAPPTIEKKAYRDPEVISQARSVTDLLMKGLAQHQEKTKKEGVGNEGKNGSTAA